MRKPAKFKLGIRQKIILFFIFFAAICAIIGIVLGYFWGAKIIKNSIGADYAQMARLMASSIDELFNIELNKLEVHAASPNWQNAISEANLKYKTTPAKNIEQYLLSMDKRWIPALDDDPLVKDCLFNPMSLRLKALEKVDSAIREIFLTDKFGGLVASSGRTSDFYQADEAWWQEAYAAGSGKPYIGDVVFDQSSNILSLTFALPVRDKDNQVIGICKAVVDVGQFFQAMANFHLGSTGEADLINQKGEVIFHRGIPPLSIKLLPGKDLLNARRSWIILSVSGPRHEKEELIAFSQVKHPLLLKQGIIWFALVHQDTEEVFAPLHTLILRLALILFVVMIMLALLGFVFGGMFIKPIRKLQEAVKRIGEGDLNYHVKIDTGDEIGQLADSFNQMAADLKRTTTSVDSLNKEIAQRKLVENNLANEERAIKRAREELEKKNTELQKLDQLKSEFISMVSHELRTPLSITKEGISLVLDGISGEINEKQQKILNTSRDNVDRLARIINELLDISRIEAGRVEIRRESVNINELIYSGISFFQRKAKEKGLELKFDLPQKGIDVYVDKDKITEVFANLLDNAIKFTRAGMVTVTVSEKEGKIVCSVEDTGVGIMEEDLSKIFGKFQQFSRPIGPGEKGTGLGLAIAKGLVELHKGKIWVENKLNQGAKFSFSLPNYTYVTMVKEYLDLGTKDSLANKTCFSLIRMLIANFDNLVFGLTADKLDLVLDGLENVIHNNLRKAGDAAFKGRGEFSIFLMDCNKESALRIEERLKETINNYLLIQGFTDKIHLEFTSSVYPDAAKPSPKLLEKAPDKMAKKGDSSGNEKNTGN